jgi:hypothetical protein
MADLAIENIRLAIQERQFATITQWNRLEGRPRATDFARSMRAEVRDPIWMLSRQWQLGEFQGDDAGSPVFAKIHVDTQRLSHYRPNGHAARPVDEEMPLEAQVEQRPLPMARGRQWIGLDIRLLMGRQWLKLLAPVGDFKNEFVDLYRIALPDPATENDVEIVAHEATWQRVAAVAERAMDGFALYRHLKDDGAHHAHDGTTIPASHHEEVDRLAERFVTWFERLYMQPGNPAESAWRPSYLEYQFGLAAAGDQGMTVLAAEEYSHGRLDWYNLDLDPAAEGMGDEPAPDDLPPPTRSFIPVPLEYEGMPHTRWWTFEDSRTNWGDVSPSTTDLAKLMLIEFGLVYANDWFLFPLTLPTGTLTSVRGLAITNVFGERIWIDAAGRGRDEDWQRWSMFTLDTRGEAGVAADTRFLLLPTVPKVQSGTPLEEVVFVRDEMANMVWAIESRVAMVDGRSVPGYEAATDLRRRYERLVNDNPAPPPPPPTAPLRYQVMSQSVPENWIPFIPVHVPGQNREVQLQRAALPRIIPRDPQPFRKVRPRTALVREGLDTKLPYFVHEEEVPRAGALVRQAFQRTRWYGGRVAVWLGAEKTTGLGEGQSNLRFDQLVVPKPQD